MDAKTPTKTPSKAKAVKVEGTENNKHGLSADDVNFVFDCLMHPVGGGTIAVSGFEILIITGFTFQLHLTDINSTLSHGFELCHTNDV
jgi:hypothetical protein